MSARYLGPPRVLTIAHEPHAGLGRMGDFDGALIDERRPDLGDPLPLDLSEHEALVVLGGSMAAWQDEAAPWLPATRRLLAQGVESGRPTLGICLGAQLLALATGGTVARGGAGLEVGLVEVSSTPQAAKDPFFTTVTSRLGARFEAVQWHQDAITALPAGAVLTMTGTRYPHQGFAIGDRAWGVQYHPEVTATDWADWMDNYHGTLVPHGLDRDQVDAPVVAAEKSLNSVGAAHLRAFARVLAVSA